MAVDKIDGQKSFTAIDTLFEHQTDFFDKNTFDKSRRQIYAELSKLLGEKTCIDSEKILEQLMPENGDLEKYNRVVPDVKLRIKFGRKRGVHVTPTVFLNGMEEPSISSGWTNEQWAEFLQKNFQI